MSVQCTQPHMHLTGYSHHHHHVTISRPCIQRPRESFNADSDAPSTSTRLHTSKSSGMHNKHFIYTHTLSHKFTQCAHITMLDKPAHSDCSHVVHNRALPTQCRCSSQLSIPHSIQMYISKHNVYTRVYSVITLGEQASFLCVRWVIQQSRCMLLTALQGTPPCQCDTHACMHACVSHYLSDHHA